MSRIIFSLSAGLAGACPLNFPIGYRGSLILFHPKLCAEFRLTLQVKQTKRRERRRNRLIYETLTIGIVSEGDAKVAGKSSTQQRTSPTCLLKPLLFPSQD